AIEKLVATIPKLTICHSQILHPIYEVNPGRAMFVVGPENLLSRLRLPFHRSESSHGTDPSPVSFTLVHVIPRQGHAVQLPRELRLKNHQTAIAECQLARSKVKFPHAAKPLIGKLTFLSVTLY